MSSSVTSPKRIRKYYAIEGLNSHHVTNNVIASQRLSSRLIKKFDIIGQFKHYNVVSVVNLQERGEHAYCGDGILEKSGFSYDPEEDLMKHKSMYNIVFRFEFLNFYQFNTIVMLSKTCQYQI
ncbi:hypothetical protein NAEGRDRAFT_67231 [Naegleria gruberi]|uniref:Uncharacterized protein FM158 n=1 Tax=Naegleria gruberi TaxID=5762 RepID=D2VEC6_NAEGR|nr:uncharacterized protein NAEGRDRAFT_67231 [Naegleria gruberi]EFC44774.1 hypothetical protein NAEGRDRAFT_67231 [Naegleria gruberi]|eukprot:XP_002677518.1 hypothetical protein NAEGRDRAFT_67231 [Naegleria gruberi strain NEG-M]